MEGPLNHESAARRATQGSVEKAVIAQEELDGLTEIGARASRRIGAKIVLSVSGSKSKTGTTTEHDIGPRVAEAARPLVALLTNAMLAAHAQGRLRVILEAAAGTSIELARSSYNEAVKALRKQLALKDIDLAGIKGKYGWAAQKVHRDIVDQVDRYYKSSIKDAVERGESPEKAAAFFVENYMKGGFAAAEPHVLEAHFRTNMQMAYHAGKWNAAMDPATKVWGWEYVTMRDDLVRPAHRDLDGTTLPKEHPTWATIYPPNGWNCRCIAVELFRKRRLVQPVSIDVDEGFRFNPGVVYQDAIRRKQKRRA